MQEEVEQKTVALVISASKLTGRELKKAIAKLLAHMKDKKNHPNIPQGKQTVKQLAGQGQGMTSIEITDQNIKDFERVAKKYGVDFAVMKDKHEIPPKYVVYFKGKDADAITNAFKEYTADMVKKAARPSVLAELRKLAELAKNIVIQKVKHKDKEQSL
ncbi:MAG: PcfB family protein [Lachnospiraceae bacterium]